MKTIVFSCKYGKLLPYFAIQFNKYFSPDQEVVVLSPRPLPPLPDNFSHFLLPGYSISWCNDLQPFFDQFSDEYFHACMEDHFLYDDVDMQVIEDAKTYMEWEYIDKFGFLIGTRSGTKPFAANLRYNVARCLPYIYRPSRKLPDNVSFAANLRYKQFTLACNLVSSLQPSVWRTSFFKKILDSSQGLDAWEFEIKNKKESLVTDHICIYQESPEPYPVADVVRRSQPNKAFWGKCVTDVDDIAIFEAATKAVFS